MTIGKPTQATWAPPSTAMRVNSSTRFSYPFGHSNDPISATWPPGALQALVVVVADHHDHEVGRKLFSIWRIAVIQSK